MNLISLLSSKYKYRLDNINNHCDMFFKQGLIHHKYYILCRIEHSNSVISKLNKLVEGIDSKKKLSNHEIFCLLASAYLHDVGMECEYPDDRNRVKRNVEIKKEPYTMEELIRSEHHLRSGQYIIEKREILGLNYAECICIKLICEGHRLVNLDSYEEEFFIGDNPIRIRFLAALLRIADELDISFERAPSDLRQFFDEMPNSLQLHWLKYHYTTGVGISTYKTNGTIKTNIEIQTQFPDVSIGKKITDELIINPIQETLSDIDRILLAYGLNVKLTHPRISQNEVFEAIPKEIYCSFLEKNLKISKVSIEESLNPHLFYSNWKLKITFDAEKIKGKLTVRTGNTILFDRLLTQEEINDNAIEIDYLERKYIPCDKDVIIFEIPNQKPVVRELDYSETISTNKRSHIHLHNLIKGYARDNLRIAVVQLKYEVFVKDYAVKILESANYRQKVISILRALEGKADIIVFPEFSIPFGYLEDIQKYSNETGIIVFAGTHYIMEENLEKYKDLFIYHFEENDFRKNICPVIMPNSKIIHSEKMFGAKEERDLFFHNGMTQGKLNHIFSLWENFNLGVLICFEYLNNELRNRLISTCNVILIPQANPEPNRFFNTAEGDLNNPLCAGNKAFIMANGIFRIGKMEKDMFIVEKNEILGGSSGVLLTLDKNTNKMLGKGIIYSKEQFVLLANINLQYSPARDIQIAPEPIKTSLIHIFEENEMRLNKKENADKFLSLILEIGACKDSKEIKNLIEGSRSLIRNYSPLMYESTANLNNLRFDEIMKKCQLIFIPSN